MRRQAASSRAISVILRATGDAEQLLFPAREEFSTLRLSLRSVTTDGTTAVVVVVVVVAAVVATRERRSRHGGDSNLFCLLLDECLFYLQLRHHSSLVPVG